MFLSTILTDLKSFLRHFLFQSKTEKYLYLALLTVYIPLAMVVIYSSSIVDHPTLEADLFFSYDNGMILRYGRTQLAAHPLITLFYYPFVLIGNGLVLLLGMKAKTILFMFLTSSMIAMSVVYVHRYLRIIVELSTKASLGFTLFFAFFSTNIILSFTPESFPLSAMFLSFGVFFFSWCIKENRPPSYFISILFGVICLGGVTITNVAKGVVPLFFQKEGFWKRTGKMFAVSAITILMILSFHVILTYVLHKDYWSDIINHSYYFRVPFESSFFYVDLYFSHMWGAPILLPEIIKYEYFNPEVNILERMVREGDYTQLWQYIYTGILFLCFVGCFIKNITNRYVLMLLALLSVDLFIHVYMQFGVAWLFMYGGHWIYLIPLVLGWLYKSVSSLQNKILVNAIRALCIAMVAILIINNGIRLVEFIKTAAEMYPPIG